MHTADYELRAVIVSFPEVIFPSGRAVVFSGCEVVIFCFQNDGSVIADYREKFIYCVHVEGSVRPGRDKLLSARVCPLRD